MICLKSQISEILLTEEPVVQIFCQHLIHLIDTSEVPKFNVFIISFSENGDLLSQWRGYCSDGGYSIGFDYEAFSKLLSAKKPVMTDNIDVELGKCVYKPNEHEEIIAEILTDTLEHYREYVRSTPSINVLDPDRVDILLNKFMLPLFKIAPLMKNECFVEEQEWRLIVTLSKDSDVSFREGVKWIIPYYKMDLVKSDEPLRIKDIIVGPTVDQLTAIKSLERFLQHEQVSYGRVIQSNIPFRG
jgi:hypothetical protein